jgi:uncharacterized protein DUF4190
MSPRRRPTPLGPKHRRPRQLGANSPTSGPDRGRFIPGDEESAETNGLAIASLFLSILWLFGIGSIVGIVLGCVGMGQIRDSGGRQGGRAIAVAGVVVGIIGLASLAVLIAFVVSSAHHEPKLPGPHP